MRTWSLNSFPSPLLELHHCNRERSRADRSSGLSRFVTRHPTVVTRAAFTLVELLVVIAIIGVLAAFIIPTISKITAMRAVSRTKTELKEVESWIVQYKAKRGYFPPDNPGNPATNQLYYELSGTVFANGVYRTLDGSSTIATNMLPAAINGFMNTMKEPRDEGMEAQKFIKELKPGQVAQMQSSFTVLVGSVGWDSNGLNPFRYVSTNPANNPGSFDLWIDIYVQGKTIRICNWSEDPL
jgi:prepilin-type N-terminal cleavage/methylation domain-containing protein